MYSNYFIWSCFWISIFYLNLIFFNKNRNFAIQKKIFFLLILTRNFAISKKKNSTHKIQKIQKIQKTINSKRRHVIIFINWILTHSTFLLLVCYFYFCVHVFFSCSWYVVCVWNVLIFFVFEGKTQNTFVNLNCVNIICVFKKNSTQVLSKHTKCVAQLLKTCYKKMKDTYLLKKKLKKLKHEFLWMFYELFCCKHFGHSKNSCFIFFKFFFWFLKKDMSSTFLWHVSKHVATRFVGLNLNY